MQRWQILEVVKMALLCKSRELGIFLNHGILTQCTVQQVRNQCATRGNRTEAELSDKSARLWIDQTILCYIAFAHNKALSASIATAATHREAQEETTIPHEIPE
jgi:hypothetical protein